MIKWPLLPKRRLPVWEPPPGYPVDPPEEIGPPFIYVNEDAENGIKSAQDSTGDIHVLSFSATEALYSVGREDGFDTTAIDTVASAGRYFRGLDLDSSEFVHLGYDDSSNNIYYQTNATGSWVSTQIWASGDGTIGAAIGDLVVDPADNPHVFFSVDNGDTTYAIKHGTNATGSWAFETVITITGSVSLSADMRSDSIIAVSATHESTAPDYWLRVIQGGWDSWSQNIWEIEDLVGTPDLVVDSDNKIYVYYATQPAVELELDLHELTNVDDPAGIFPRPLWDDDASQFDWNGISWKQSSNSGAIFYYPYGSPELSWASDLDPSQIRLEFNVYTAANIFYPQYSRIRVYYINGGSAQLYGFGGSGPTSGSFDYDKTIALSTGQGGVSHFSISLAFGGGYIQTVSKIWLYTDHWYDYTYYDRSSDPGSSGWDDTTIDTEVDRLQNFEATLDYNKYRHVMAWNNDDGNPTYYTNVRGSWTNAEIDWDGAPAGPGKVFYNGGLFSEIVYLNDDGVTYLQEDIPQ